MISISSIKYFILKHSYWLLGVVLITSLVALEDHEPWFTILFGLSVLGLAYWVFRQMQLFIRLRDEKARTELLHLQSQVNPHFFFNTLNNLYGLIERDAKQAKKMVLKLSDMMRYSIYDGQNEWVSLEQETDYLANYIELHQARYHRKTEVIFEQNIQAEQVKVLPLMFIILLENAFKHGVETLSERSYVHINLLADEHAVHFSIKNNFDPEVQSTKPGLGLKNLEKRLKLVYPKKHSLSFGAEGDIFKAELTLKLV